MPNGAQRPKVHKNFRAPAGLSIQTRGVNLAIQFLITDVRLMIKTKVTKSKKVRPLKAKNQGQLMRCLWS